MPRKQPRSIVVKVRMTPAEKSVLQAMATGQGVTMADLLRRTLPVTAQI